MWGRLRRKGLGDVLIGVVYVTPQGLNKARCKADHFVEFIGDKRQQGEEILVMGDFNAHFGSDGKALDCRAKFLNRLSEVVGLRTLNFEDSTRGKWTWQGKEKLSVFDYVLMSQELADSTSGMTIDDDGWFDISSARDHNIWYSGKVMITIKWSKGVERKKIHQWGSVKTVFGHGKQKGR